MVRMRPRPVWHLRRGQKLYGRVSDRELRLLVELGHLKSDDLLWRPGFGGWKSAESVPGVLAPAQLPPVHSLSAQLSAKITALFSAAWRWVIRSQDHARKLVRTLKYFRWPKFRFGDLSELMQRRGVLAGLLIAAMFAGSIDVAMRAFAIGAETSQKVVSPRTDNVQIVAAAPDTAKAVQTSFTNPDAGKTVRSPSEAKPEIDLTEGSGVLSVSNIHPTDGFTSKLSPGSLSPSEASAEPDSVTNTTHVSNNKSLVSQSDPAAGPDQPDAAAQPDQFDTMPLPTRKPEGPMAKEAPQGKAALKRIAHRRENGEPKPLRFGNIGFNYYAQ
jgi:GYF domain 2